MAKIYARMIFAGSIGIDDVPSCWQEATVPVLLNLYVDAINNSQMTIDEVPERWRDDVRELLGNA